MPDNHFNRKPQPWLSTSVHIPPPHRGCLSAGILRCAGSTLGAESKSHPVMDTNDRGVGDIMQQRTGLAHHIRNAALCNKKQHTEVRRGAIAI